MKTTTIKTTNCKTIIESVQRYLLDWAGDYKAETDYATESNESAFVQIINEYICAYGRGASLYSLGWSTPAGVLRHLVEGGTLEMSYCDVNNRLRSWGLNPERYSDAHNWKTYINLICRDGQRLYNKINNK